MLDKNQKQYQMKFDISNTYKKLNAGCFLLKTKELLLKGKVDNWKTMDE